MIDAGTVCVWMDPDTPDWKIKHYRQGDDIIRLRRSHERGDIRFTVVGRAISFMTSDWLQANLAPIIHGDGFSVGMKLDDVYVSSAAMARLLIVDDPAGIVLLDMDGVVIGEGQLG